MTLAKSEPEIVNRQSATGLRAGLLGLALTGLVALVYWPTLDNGFVSDDVIYIIGTQERATLAGLAEIWSKLGATSQYYPVVYTSLWAEYRLWGLDPLGYHALNLLGHALAAILLWRLLLRLRVPGAWLAAAIFAVHPVGVETVAWASERKNVLSGIFVLGSMLEYLRFAPLGADAGVTAVAARGRRSWLSYSIAFLLFVASLLSKSITVSMPAVLLVITWWKVGRITRQDVRPLLPFFAVGLFLGLLTTQMEKEVVGAIGPEWDFSWLDRVLIAGRALWFYAGKLIWPYPLAFNYPRWSVDAHVWWQWLYPLAAVALVNVLWRLRLRIGRGPLAAVLIFAGVLVPALGFFDVYPFLHSFVADHYQYHASMALIALAAAAIANAFDAWPRSTRTSKTLATAAILFPLAIVAHKQTFAYKDNDTLIRDVVASSPESWAGHKDLAFIHLSEKRYDEAIAEFREALRLFPERARLHIEIGGALVSLGKLDEAAVEFATALTSPLKQADRQAAHFQFGNALATQGNLDQAIEHYRAALELDPSAPDVLQNYAIVLGEKGDLPGAIAAAQQAVRLRPDLADAQHALGAQLLKAGRVEEATGPLEAAVRLKPDSAAYREDLAAALFRRGEFYRAESELRNALSLDARSANAHNLLGAVFGQRGDLPTAIREFRAALSIEPNHSSAADNLRRALEAQSAGDNR